MCSKIAWRRYPVNPPRVDGDAMIRSLIAAHGLVTTLLAAQLLMPSPLVAQLTAQEARGKAVYLEGASATSGEITAVIGDAGTEVPAAVMPCGGCHGPDGRGRPEGGISPSDLTWPALTKPYGVDHRSGRQHPPYTERLLKRAITMGHDPAGNKLHVAMPRYRLSHEDLADLIAYLRRLGTDLDPGITEDTLTLATLLPRDGAMASLGDATAAVLEAFLDRVNAQGGIYSRRLELQIVDAPDDPTARAAALAAHLQAGETFALVGAFLPGAEAEIATVLAEHETPLIGPLTQHPQLGIPLNPYVFYLLPGLEDIGRAMVGFAAAEDSGPALSAAVITGSAPRFAAPARAIAERASELGRPAPPIAQVDDSSTESSAEQVFLLASGEEQLSFFQQATARDWYPKIYLPGSLAGRAVLEAPPGFVDRIFLAYPTLPSNQAADSAAEYRDLATAYALPARHRAAQIATLASAHVLVEALKQAGRALSRSRLIEVLESLSEYDNGLTPLVSYGPNRRVGVQGAYMVAVDLERQTLVPASGWVKSR